MQLVEHMSDPIGNFVSYNPETGELHWKFRGLCYFPDKRKHRLWNARFSGKIAGSLNSQGYIVICINGKRYKAHRIIWLIVKGVWPVSEIDHRNEIKSDNRWGNLRQASSGQNKHNRKAYKNNTSGFKGITWNKRCQKWQAQISVDRKSYQLGLFIRIEDAISAHANAAKDLHKDFHNLSSST